MALLVALAVSAALLVDYSSASPAFCSVGSGCDDVRRSGLGYIPLPPARTYIPVPVVGLVGFGLAFGATLLSDWRNRRRWSLSLLAAGAFAAFGFLLAQAIWIGQFCSLCVTVDLAALVACALAFGIPKAGWQQTREEELGERASPFGLRPVAWAALAALAVLTPWAWPHVKPALPVPAKVAALYQPGKINVVEFADFECPFCRKLHSELDTILEDYDGRVNFVRLHMPLDRHPHARPAARAAVCAGKQGKEAAMANYLFKAESLDPPSILHGAEQLRLDLKQFKHCLAEAATDRVIDQQASILREAGFQGLPTTYVGSMKIVGAQPEQVFRQALDDAASGAEPTGVPGWVYWPLVALAFGIVLFVGRRRPPPGGTRTQAR